MRSSTSVLATLVAAAVLTGAASCQVTSTPGAATPSAAAPPAGDPAAAARQLATLRVQPDGSMAGYSREKFTHWISQGGGCDTRDAVLKREGKDITTTSDCRITGGSWVSVYDNKSYSNPQDLDVDHVVPLAAGWRSGASAWTPEQRQQFANDLTRPQLIAVSKTTNRSKGDQDPSQWTPPNRAYWCVYAQHWIAVKAHYQLTVHRAEKTALTDLLATCK